jgi:hypothetical protein
VETSRLRLRPLLDAQWTDDAQGKKDYDGSILSISTRYWPRGGGYLLVTRDGLSVTSEDNTARPAIAPRAMSHLVLHHKNGRETTDLVSQQFEGETFEGVARQVEAWAQGVMDRVVRVLQREFP